MPVGEKNCLLVLAVFRTGYPNWLCYALLGLNQGSYKRHGLGMTWGFLHYPYFWHSWSSLVIHPEKKFYIIVAQLRHLDIMTYLRPCPGIPVLGYILHWHYYCILHWYYCAKSGKWHKKTIPMSRGFHKYMGCPISPCTSEEHPSEAAYIIYGGDVWMLVPNILCLIEWIQTVTCAIFQP